MRLFRRSRSPPGRFGRRTLVLLIAVSLLLVVFSVISSQRYGSVVIAKLSIDLTDTIFQVDETIGHIEFILSTNLRNPSSYALRLWSMSWLVQLPRISDSDGGYATFVKDFRDLHLEQAYVPPDTIERINLNSIVTNGPTRAEILRLRDAYREGQGITSMEDLPWSVTFQIELWIDDFRRDYPNVNLFYLRDMVHLELGYRLGT